MSIFDQMGFSNLELDDNIMSVDEMTLIPIRRTPGTGRDLTEEVADPENIDFDGNQSYGEMRFRNNDSRPAIINTNTTVISDKSAQDHSMSGPGIVLANSSKKFDNCCCVQSSQGGYLEGNDERNQFYILPIFLRKKLLNPTLRSKKEYGKLWDSISAFTSRTTQGRRSRGHLEDFFRDVSISKQLDNFVAEFEPVPHQVGAVIMFNQKIVGIEIQPSVRHWLFYWEWYIRGCYGAELIQKRLEPGYKTRMLEITIPLDAFNIKTHIDQQKMFFMTDLSTTIEKGVIPSIKGGTVSQVPKTNLSTQLLSTSKGGGDIIIDNKTSQAIYLSMVL